MIDRVSGPCSLSVLVVAIAAWSCAQTPASRQYELHGQIIGIDRDRQEVLVKHEDIKGFMPGMTMPFKVKEVSLIDGCTLGDLITATLVVSADTAYLSSLRKTGSAPIDQPPPAPSASSGFELLKPGEDVPDEAFIDQDGKAWRVSSLRGRAIALTFIYTRCPIPTFCPLMDRQFAVIQKTIAHTPSLRDRVHLLSMTFDPAHDTPAVLKQHARGLGADRKMWSFLTGNRDDIDRFAARFGISVVREVGSPEIANNLRTVVIDPAGKLVKVYTGIEWTPQQVIEDLERVSDSATH